MTDAGRPGVPALLLTRPEAASRRFLQKLRNLAPVDEVVISPLIEIVATGAPVDLTGIGSVIFTSAHAVAQAGVGGNLPALCVGAHTRAAAKEGGFDAVLAGLTAEELVQTLVASPPAGPILYLRGVHVRTDIAAQLNAAGQTASEIVVYDQKAKRLSDDARQLLKGTRPVILPLFSPRAAQLLAEEPPAFAPLWVAAMSPAVADTAAPLHPARMCTAGRPDAASMCAAVASLFRNAAPLEGPKSLT